MKSIETDDKFHVLVVEDELYLCEAYKQFAHGTYEFHVVNYGKEAISWINNHDPDAVVLDFKLPDASGLDVFTAIKAKRPHVPIILTTAYGTKDAVVRTLLKEVQDYLKKPYSFHELIAKLECNIKLQRNVITGENGKKSSMNLKPEASVNHYKIGKVIQFIHSKYAEKINLDFLAEISCMSKRHLSRIFKKYIGVTTQNYINNLRIEKAEAMLNKGELTVTEIAFLVGFSDLTHFERMFKKKHGHSPLKYRHRNSGVIDKLDDKKDISPASK